MPDSRRERRFQLISWSLAVPALRILGLKSSRRHLMPVRLIQNLLGIQRSSFAGYPADKLVRYPSIRYYSNILSWFPASYDAAPDSCGNSYLCLKLCLKQRLLENLAERLDFRLKILPAAKDPMIQLLMPEIWRKELSPRNLPADKLVCQRFHEIL